MRSFAYTLDTMEGRVLLARTYRECWGRNWRHCLWSFPLRYWQNTNRLRCQTRRCPQFEVDSFPELSLAGLTAGFQFSHTQKT